MKRNQLLGLFTLIFGLSVLTNLTVEAEQIVYRLYNKHNGEHLYTTDRNERDALYFHHGWGYEGQGWIAPDSGTPVYRLYNAGLQNHLYTSDLNEIKELTTRHGWIRDNGGKPVFYSGGNTAIYRVYNPALRGLHHWTTDQNEYNVLPRHGWKQEGIKFHAIRPGKQVKTHYRGTIDYRTQGISDPVFLVAEEAAEWAFTVFNDPNSGYYHYKDYTVMYAQAYDSNGTYLYYVEFK